MIVHTFLRSTLRLIYLGQHPDFNRRGNNTLEGEFFYFYSKDGVEYLYNAHYEGNPERSANVMYEDLLVLEIG